MLETKNVTKISTEMTYELRQSILRPNGTIEDCKFPGDNDANSTHFGAYQNENLVGIASLYRELLPEQEQLAGWRIRGMATHPSVRGKRYGLLLLQYCITSAKKNEADVLWCNARSSAVGFYQELDFESIGDEFDIPTIGLHYRMALYF